MRKWLKKAGVGTLFIEPGSPWENGYIESFDGGNAINHDGRMPDDVTLISATGGPVPEPATLAMLALGGLALIRRKRVG